MEVAVFLTFALLAVVSAVTVIAHRNPVYSTMSLVVTLFATAVLFVLLGAPFLAALQLLLYTGAILVLFLFVLMLLNVGREKSIAGRRGQIWGAAVSCALFLGVLARALLASPHAPLSAVPPPTMEEVARVLFTSYLLPFEVIGVLLLVAVIAATLIARRPPAAVEER